MQRTFCDFCGAQIETNAAWFDEETRFADRNVVVRIDLRDLKDEQTAGLTRPDVCFDCRKGIIAQMFGLSVPRGE